MLSFGHSPLCTVCGLLLRPQHRLYDQTDLYFFHEPCWQRLLEHFSPQEFDLSRLFEALEHLPLPPALNLIDMVPDDEPVDTVLDAVDGKFQGHLDHPNLDDLRRFARAPPRPWCPVVRSSPLAKHHFDSLPLEIIEMIAVMLPTRDVLSLRQVSRGVAPIFASSNFWKTRFYLNDERGFLWPAVRDFMGAANRQEEIDWRLLYHSTSQLNCSTWLLLERKIWEALRWLRDTALALAYGTPRPPDYRSMALHHYHNTLIRGTHLETVNIDSPVRQVAISAHSDISPVHVTGLEFFFKDRPKASLGYTLLGAKEMSGEEYRDDESVQEYLEYPGIRVTVDLEDLRGIIALPTSSGIQSVLLVPSFPKPKDLQNQCVYSVGHTNTQMRASDVSPAQTLEQITQVVAVLDNRKMIDIGVWGRSSRRCPTWPKGVRKRLIKDYKKVNMIPAELELK
ncbi:F-box protein [Aspergillus niger CBS 101883]|uniref:F-box protein n=1 Tax=Aspergillus lacticoffeatus (strain CBS 101883) TaxID=1450533 RepID=UPI000D805B8A|nr:uncharacterized protein BO96DRAFT_346262 [Aspergillus niger CBS 101883]PYH52989.1 hypothetical protein BO96DRAFT_346262 [Aspergillus niger CBS 101883]